MNDILKNGQKRMKIKFSLQPRAQPLMSLDHFLCGWVKKSKGCQYNIVRSSQSVAKVKVSCVGVKGEESKRGRLN